MAYMERKKGTLHIGHIRKIIPLEVLLGHFRHPLGIHLYIFKKTTVHLCMLTQTNSVFCFLLRLTFSYQFVTQTMFKNSCFLGTFHTMPLVLYGTSDRDRDEQHQAWLLGS